MKTFVLIVSEKFPKTHFRAGEDTGFIKKIIRRMKIHTIRKNLPMWVKRFKDIDAGEACIAIRVWTGDPYKSPQKEIFRLTRENQIGIEKAVVSLDGIYIAGQLISKKDVARNDGLTLGEFNDWFKTASPGDEFACIHFTNFRYTHEGSVRKG